MMTNEEAKKIIDAIRISNSFTMHLTTDEYIKDFRSRYLKIYGIIIPNNYISVAEVIQNLDKKIV